MNNQEILKKLAEMKDQATWIDERLKHYAQVTGFRKCVILKEWEHKRKAQGKTIEQFYTAWNLPLLTREGK